MISRDRLAAAVRGPEKKRAASSARRTKVSTGSCRRYGQAALRAETDAVADTLPGGRNARLNTAAFNLGQLVGTQALDEPVVVDVLYAAAEACGLVHDKGEHAARATIRSGLEAGKAKPRTDPVRKTRSTTLPRSEAIESRSTVAVEPIPSIPPECWRGAFDSYRRAVARCTEAADSLHFIVFATITGLVIGRRAWLKYARSLFANFYACLIGPTGRARKTSAMDLGDQLLERFAEGGIASIDSCSWEGLIAELDGEFKRVRMRPGEFRLLATKARQDSSAGILAGLTHLYDCPLTYRHKLARSEIDVRRPFLAILTPSTAEWFRDSFDASAVAGGFLNRFLFVDGESKQPIPFPDDPDARPWADALRALVEMDARLSAVPLQPGQRVELTSAARAFWEQFYANSLAWDYPTDVLRQMAVRLPEHAMKLALVYAVLEGSEAIDAEHLEAGCAFATWQRDAHVRIFDGFGKDRSGQVEGAIRRALGRFRAKGRKVRRWELQRALGGRFNAWEFNRSLAALLEAELVAEDADGLLFAPTLADVGAEGSNT